MDYEVNYKERMLNYYPPVIKVIKDFQAIVDSEAPELSDIHTNLSIVLNDAYLETMCESRIKQWESMLNIVPLQSSSVDDRRDVIIARLRGQGKLNTELINTIVGTFTGGTANSWFENSTLYVEITPSPTNKQYRFENIEAELQNKVPCHIGLSVTRNYYDWSDVTKDISTWQDVKDNFDTWEDVLLHVAS